MEDITAKIKEINSGGKYRVVTSMQPFQFVIFIMNDDYVYTIHHDIMDSTGKSKKETIKELEKHINEED